MDIDELKAFLAVSDAGSFSDAAERLFVTQPAVSKRISSLEHTLGVKLFDRIGRSIDLSPAGQALLPRARNIINEIEDARRNLTNLSGEVRGILRLATSHHAGLHRLPPALKRFHESFPSVRLDLRFMDSEQGCNLVMQGKIELAAVTLPPNPPAQLALLPVWDDPLEVVVSPSHELAQRDWLTPNDLLAFPAILPGQGTYTRELILHAFGSRRDTIVVGLSSNYLEVIRMLTAIGLGWSVLPRTLIDANLKVIHIQDMRIERRLGIVSHRARTLSTAAQRMIEVVETTQ